MKGEKRREEGRRGEVDEPGSKWMNQMERMRMKEEDEVEVRVKRERRRREKKEEKFAREK